MNKKITLRPWQTKAVKTIAQALCVPHSLVAVNACVGSGKTFVPFEAIVNFIKKHKNEKTFHTFVCPRIKLCKQQKREAEKLFADRGLNVSVKIWNSDSDDVGQRYVDGNEFWDSTAKHIVCVICDESLWGISVSKNTDGSQEEKFRYERFVKMLKNNVKYNRINGIIAYDEAHNYKTKQKFMFGEKKCLEVK